MSTFKPQRQFNGTPGQPSEGAGGPDMIERDLDEINVMFNPETTHANGDPGGIGAGNLNESVLLPEPEPGATISERLASKTITGLNEAGTSTPAATVWTQIKSIFTTLVTHVSSVSNPHIVTKSQVGLGNADNTSDADKPLSTAMTAALNLLNSLKVNVADIVNTLTETAAGKVLDARQGAVLDGKITSHTSNVENPHLVKKSQVGLGAVNNTSDADKPISTAQAAEFAKMVKKDGSVAMDTLTVTGNASAGGDMDIGAGKKYKIGGTNLSAADVDAIPKTRKVNDKELSVDISLDGRDITIGAVEIYQEVLTEGSSTTSTFFATQTIRCSSAYDFDRTTGKYSLQAPLATSLDFINDIGKYFVLNSNAENSYSMIYQLVEGSHFVLSGAYGNYRYVTPANRLTATSQPSDITASDPLPVVVRKIRSEKISVLDIVNDLTTGGETVPASAETVKTLKTQIGAQTFTEKNYVTDGASDTANIDALDMAVKDNADLISSNGAILNKVESISIESILPNNAAAWEFGALSLGDETASTTKIRTVGFIAVTPSTKYILTLLNSFLDFQITQYGTAAAGSGADYYITNSAFLATDTEMTLNAACTKIRVVAQPHSGSIEGMTVAAIMAVARFSLLPRTSDKQIKLKVMSHNVGTYSYGIDPQGIPDADIDEKKILWRKMLADNDCDVLGMQEFRPKIDVSNSIDTIATIYNFPYNYTVGDYSYQFMASKYQLKKTARKQLTDGTYRYYSKAYITVDGIEVCIVNTHLQSGDNAPTRALEIAEIIAAVAGESHVIIMGDFNIAAAAELDPFTAAGYTLANTGWFGDFLTHPYNAAANLYDNIIVSANIRIDNTYLGDNITSDHFPIIAELSIIKTA